MFLLDNSSTEARAEPVFIRQKLRLGGEIALAKGISIRDARVLTIPAIRPITVVSLA